jgi:heterodisulfide reductase subunit A-like polyferredoxin
MAVDMDIARRAAVFIGNGVCGPLSSLTVANAGVVEQLYIEHRPSTVGGWQEAH